VVGTTLLALASLLLLVVGPVTTAIQVTRERQAGTLPVLRMTGLDATDLALAFVVAPNAFAIVGGVSSALLGGLLLTLTSGCALGLVPVALLLALSITTHLMAIAVGDALGLRLDAIVVGALVGAALLVPGAGHLGGELVHGEGYLSEPFRAPAASAPLEPVSTEKGLAFADVQPILQARCVECHGPLKQKGELRLDAFDTRWFEPGEFGTVVVAGRAAESELVRRMRLPLDDEDHMPPAKKPQHSVEELAALERWIDSGARP